MNKNTICYDKNSNVNNYVFVDLLNVFINRFNRSILFSTTIIALLLGCFSNQALLNAALTYSIAGVVIDKETAEPLIGATVMLEKTKLGTRTNKSGFYSIQQVPVGEYNLIARYMGYKETSQKITISAKSDDLRINIELEPTSVLTDEVQVFASKEVEAREIVVSKVNVPVSQIKEIRFGGESDVFRSLQFLPGVLTSSQISSGLYVRGGSPDQNLVLLDGAVVYNPSHLFGFYSAFNTNAIKDVDFIKGGFDAEYGGRLASVLNLTQKDGNKKEVEGSINLSLISSQADVGIPLGNGSIFVSGRRTYFDLIKPVMNAFTDEEIPDFYFYDFNAKVTQNFGDNDKIAISGFYGQDAFIWDGGNVFSMDMGLGNRTLSGYWSHIFSNDLFSNLVVYYSKYSNKWDGGQMDYNFIIDNSIEDISAKINFDWFIGKDASVKFGVEAKKLGFDFLVNVTGDTTQTQQGEAGQVDLLLNDYNYSAFVQSKFNLTEYLSVQSGVRGSFFYLNSNFFVEPRVALRYMLTGNIALKAAWGLYNQGLRIAGLPGFSIMDIWLPSDTSVSAANAIHYIFSVETKPSEYFDLNFDFYYKSMHNTAEINQLSFMQLGVDKVSSLLFMGNAQAYGAEVFLQKSFGRLTGWIGYGFGVVWAQHVDINDGKRFHPKFDRTHDFKIVAQYKLSEKFDVGGTFTFQSGQSYTGATSRGQVYMPSSLYGNSKVVMSEQFGLRLPNSHQLNVFVAYNFHIYDFPSRISLDINNIYNRRDILMRVYNTRSYTTKVQDIRLFPIIPSISLEVKF